MNVKIIAHGIRYYTGGEQLKCPECITNEIDVTTETVFEGKEIINGKLNCECLQCHCRFVVTKEIIGE